MVLVKLITVRAFQVTQRMTVCINASVLKVRPLRRKSLNRTGLLLLLPGLFAVSAFAGTISYDCDTTDSNQISSQMCTALTGTIAGQFASIYMNANALVYVEYGAPAGDVASTTQVFNTVTYSAYYTALTSHPSQLDSADNTAIASLGRGSTNPVVSGDGVGVTSALDQALGLTGGFGITTADTSCTVIGLGSTAANSCFNAIISVSKSIGYSFGTPIAGDYDFITAVEHETDEVLGTASCISNANPSNNSNPTHTPLDVCVNSGAGVSAADLFRYSANGTRSFLGATGQNQARGSLAYFSIDSGATDIAAYYNGPNSGNGNSVGEDYGDWSTGCKYVQDANGCQGAGGLNIPPDGGLEIAVLDSVGYQLTIEGQDLSATIGAPEPGTIGMALMGLGLLAGYVRRQRPGHSERDTL